MGHLATLSAFQDAWQATLPTLARVARGGGSLGNRERGQLRTAEEACSALIAGLAGLSPDRDVAWVAGGLAEVVQPTCSRIALAEELFRIRTSLGRLAAGEAGLERLTLDGAHLAWLHAILSARSLDLARVPAGVRRRALAPGT